DALEPSSIAEIGTLLDAVAPTLRTRAVALTKGMATPAAEATPAVDVRSLEARIASLGPGIAERWGLAKAAAAVAEGRYPEPIQVVPGEADFVPIQPIASPDELLECIAQAVETLRHGDEIERILDAIARYSDRSPESKVAQTVFARLK